MCSSEAAEQDAAMAGFADSTQTVQQPLVKEQATSFVLLGREAW